LHADRLNENRGAEATLAFLQSLTKMHAIENLVEVIDLQQRTKAAEVPQLSS